MRGQKVMDVMIKTSANLPGYRPQTFVCTSEKPSNGHHSVFMEKVNKQH